MMPVLLHQFSDNTLPDDRRYLIMASGTLRIVRVTREDEGNYDCHAVNTAGQRHATAQIEIRPRGKSGEGEDGVHGGGERRRW